MTAIRVVLIAVFLVSSARGYGVTTIAQTPGNQTEEEAIRTVIIGITEAFNKHDAKAWTSLATPDAQLVTVRGESMNGVEEIEKGLSVLFQTRNRYATVRVLSVRVRFIRPDVALAHVTSELTDVVSSDGQTLPATREFSLRVFTKDRGAWRITAFHNTPLQP